MMSFSFQLPRVSRLSLTPPVFGHWRNYTDSCFITTFLPTPSLALNSLCSYFLQWPELHSFIRSVPVTLHMQPDEPALNIALIPLLPKTSKNQDMLCLQHNA